MNNRPDLDHFFLNLAKIYSTRSRDPSTKVGSIIVRPDHTVAACGYNGFPRGMEDKEEWYQDRTEKYPRIIHAEMNAILSCKDHDTKNYTCYIWPFQVCDRCYVHLVNRGFNRFVAPTPTEEQRARWGDSFNRVITWAKEMNIEMVEVNL